MTKSELIEQTKELITRIEALLPTVDLETKNNKYKELGFLMAEPEFWDDSDQAQKISQQAAHLDKTVKLWDSFLPDSQNLLELLEMAESKDIAELESEYQRLEKSLESAETHLLLGGEYDHLSAIITLQVGNGGQDAEDFTQMIQRMLMRFAEQHEYKINIIDESHTDSGLRSCHMEIIGPYAYGFLKSEHGVHRLIRLSPFNAKNLRQTSFTRIEVLPMIEQEHEIDIDEKDIRVDVFRSGGAGGQSVNTTDSAVRITYLPLNLSVTCQNERSQHQNKESAMRVLQSRLLQLQIEQNTAELKELRGDLMENAFGSQIRTYTLQPYKLVKDHRTNFEFGNPEKVLDGDLMPFIEAYLKNPK